MCVISNLNSDVQEVTFTNALHINVLLARLDHEIVELVCLIPCVAVQLIANVSAVVVQSGATVVLAVTVVDHAFTQLALSNSLGLLIY